MSTLTKYLNRKILFIQNNIDGIKKKKIYDNSRYKYNNIIMKVNHAGEISAQYLYYGQSYFNKEAYIKYFLLKSAKEEKKHLFWCINYLDKTNSSTSSLFPIWKNGSFFIGLLPNFFYYKYNLGFLVETELKVAEHLRDQITSLSKLEYNTFFILKKMLEDEVKHANNAILLHSRDIQFVYKKLMNISSFIMVNTASYI